MAKPSDVLSYSFAAGTTRRLTEYVLILLEHDWLPVQMTGQPISGGLIISGKKFRA
jgi:hypothetical protein